MTDTTIEERWQSAANQNWWDFIPPRKRPDVIDWCGREIAEAVAAERERCARIVQQRIVPGDESWSEAHRLAELGAIAAAIRGGDDG